MYRLHGGDYPQFGKAGNVIGVQMLCMLYTEPVVLACVGKFFKGSFVTVQNFPVGTVTNGVGTNLKAVLQSVYSGFLYKFHGQGFVAKMSWSVGIFLQQPSPART